MGVMEHYVFNFIKRPDGLRGIPSGEYPIDSGIVPVNWTNTG
jgi:hypothetical protein